MNGPIGLGYESGRIPCGKLCFGNVQCKIQNLKYVCRNAHLPLALPGKRCMQPREQVSQLCVVTYMV